MSAHRPSPPTDQDVAVVYAQLWRDIRDALSTGASFECNHATAEVAFWTAVALGSVVGERLTPATSAAFAAATYELLKARAHQLAVCDKPGPGAR
jgi:hypothetical protein